MNVHHIVGRIGKDPEVRRLNNGDMVASFSIATSNRWTDKETGEKKEHTDWHSVVCFNQNIVSKIIEPHVKKGFLVQVTGAVQTRSFEDQKSGETKYRTETVIGRFDGNFQILDKPGERKAPSEGDYGQTKTRLQDQAASASGRDQNGSSGYARRDDPPTQRSGGASRPLDDDEIPF